MRYIIISLMTTLMASNFTSAQEQDSKLSYNFVEATYVHNNFDSENVTLSGQGLNATIGDSTGNGFSIKGSYQFIDHDKIGIYLTSDYFRTTHTSGIAFSGTVVDSGLIDVTRQEFRAALGSYISLTDAIDLFAEIGYLDTKASLGNFVIGSGSTGDLNTLSFAGNSIDARVGFRAKVSDKFEVNGYVRRNPHSQVDVTTTSSLLLKDQFKANVGFRWYAYKNISFGADYEFGKPGHLRLGSRISF